MSAPEPRITPNECWFANHTVFEEIITKDLEICWLFCSCTAFPSGK